MKKALILVLIISSLFIALSSVAQTIEAEKGYISVNSAVVKEILPNQAEISFNIETSDKSLKKASEENKQIATRVYSNIKPILGVSDYLKTGQYSARPVYIYLKDNKKALDKYIVSNTVTVKTKNNDNISKLIDTAISSGSTGVENLQFSVVDYDSICSDNLADLTKKAYIQANSVAKSINAQVIGVKSINATCNTDSSPRPYYAMMAKGVTDSVSSTPIESGKIKLNICVDASFYVK